VAADDGTCASVRRERDRDSEARQRRRCHLRASGWTAYSISAGIGPGRRWSGKCYLGRVTDDDVNGITSDHFVQRRVPVAEVARRCAHPNRPSCHTLDARAVAKRGPACAHGAAIIGSSSARGGSRTIAAGS
jgi:hypothetical protein